MCESSVIKSPSNSSKPLSLESELAMGQIKICPKAAWVRAVSAVLVVLAALVAFVRVVCAAFAASIMSVCLESSVSLGALETRFGILLDSVFWDFGSAFFADMLKSLSSKLCNCPPPDKV